MSSRDDVKNYFLTKMKGIRREIREQVAERAADNLIEYYRLLRSTQVPGIENLITAIHKSSFSCSRSNSHHNYVGGTLEHSLGVYHLMSKEADRIRKMGYDINENEVILVGLLHDVCKGKHDDWGFDKKHGSRSRNIVELYLPNLSDDILEAIEKHMHGGKFKVNGKRREVRPGDNILHYIICKADYPDGKTCDKGYVKLNDTQVVPLR